jgi:hypothetical protein
MPRYDSDEDLAYDEIDDEYDDWNESPWWQAYLPVTAALVVGIILGVVLGAQFFSPSTVSGNTDNEACLVLASELYHQGESLDIVREHLQALGYDNAAPTLLKLADEYDRSEDLRKSRFSADLRQLGNALLTDGQKIITPAVIAMTTPISTATVKPANTPAGSTNTEQPTSTPESVIEPTEEPAIEPTEEPVTSPPTATPPPVPTQDSDPTSEGDDTLGPATITSSGGEGAIMRDEPSSNASIVAYLGHGTQVEALEIVNGEAIDETEPRWYHIKHGTQRGYVYYKLLAFGD